MDEEIFDRMLALDPKNLLPFERRWEESLPQEHCIPKTYKGSFGKGLFDNEISPIGRHPGVM